MAKRIDVSDKEIRVYSGFKPGDPLAAPAILPYFKSFSQWEYDGGSRAWIFPNTSPILRSLKKNLQGYTVRNVEKHFLALSDTKKKPKAKTRATKTKKKQTIVRKALNQKDEVKTYKSLIEAADLDKKLPCGYTAYKHQKIGAGWLLESRSAGLYGRILADEVGLGKSLESLLAARALQRELGLAVIVICPASLIDNWYREAKNAGVKVDVYSYNKIPKSSKNKFVLICDEAHYLQSGSGSKRGREVIALSSMTTCWAAFLLTGSPMKAGRPINLLPLLEICGSCVAKDNYKYKYCRHQTAFGMQWTGSHNLDELSEKTKDVILQRTKEECTDLPKNRRVIRPITLSTSMRRKYKSDIKAKLDDYRLRAEAGEVASEAEALVMVQYMRAVASLYKVPYSVEQAQEVLDSGKSIVLFTEFVATAKELNKQLGGELLIGSVKASDRQALIDRFQSGQSKVFVGTTKAAGVGLTLTKASTSIVVDRPWTTGDVTQVEGRIHRISQTEDCLTIWPQLQDSIDLRVDEVVQAGEGNVKKIMSNKKLIASVAKMLKL